MIFRHQRLGYDEINCIREGVQKNIQVAQDGMLTIVGMLAEQDENDGSCGSNDDAQNFLSGNHFLDQDCGHNQYQQRDGGNHE